MKKSLKLIVFTVVLCAVSALNVKVVLDTEHSSDLAMTSLAAIGEGNSGEGGSGEGGSGESSGGQESNNSFMSTYRVGLVVVHFIDTLVLVSLLLQLMISLVQMDNIQKPQYLAWKRLVLGKMAMDVLYIVASRLTNCMSPIYSEYEISSLRINFTDICKLSDTK